jgi:hypothetical protein
VSEQLIVVHSRGWPLLSAVVLAGRGGVMSAALSRESLLHKSISGELRRYLQSTAWSVIFARSVAMICKSLFCSVVWLIELIELMDGYHVHGFCSGRWYNLEEL